MRRIAMFKITLLREIEAVSTKTDLEQENIPQVKVDPESKENTGGQIDTDGVITSQSTFKLLGWINGKLWTH